jgi:hypothetical protein
MRLPAGFELRPLGTVVVGAPCIHRVGQVEKKYKRVLPNGEEIYVEADSIACRVISSARARDEIVLNDHGEFTLVIEGLPLNFKEIDNNNNEEYPIRLFNPYANPPPRHAFKKSRSKKSRSKKSKGKKKSNGKKKSKKSN